MVFLLPASPVHAGSATVSLSTETSGVLTAATSGTVGSSLVITGTGFNPAAVITISSTVGSTVVPWLTQGTCSTTDGGHGTADSLLTTATGPSQCLTASASGGFQVTAAVPAMTGGAQTITVSDGTNTVNTAFTVTSKIALTYPGNNFGFPEESLGSTTFTATGFGATETVTVTATAFTTASFSITTCTTNSVGSCSFADSLVIADQTGGAKTITATGGTSALTASSSITVNPWAAFYDSSGGKTTYSFIGTQPTSIIAEAHGLPAGTMAANSVTIGGISTFHSAVTIGSTGAFYGLVVAPTAQVPFGQATVVIDGTTFSYALGNIALGAGTWGGVLISSIIGTGSSTAVLTTDASSYKPGTGFTASTTSPTPAQNQVAFFGYGFVPSVVASVTVGNGGSGLGGVTSHGTGTNCNGTCDVNGAFFGTATLGDTPWSAAATPTVAASYAPAVAQVGGPANILGPSFGITNWQTIGTTTVDYTTTGEVITVHGFSASEGITATIGGSTLALTTCTTGTNGEQACSASGAVPDLASGAQAVVTLGSLSGVKATTAAGVTYDPNVSGSGALSLNSGAPGTTTILRTGSTYGPHGLAANTAYNIMWNSQGGSQTVGTFTSTATGGVPIPGVQFTVPSDAAGFHTLDIVAAGSSAIYGSTKAGDTTPSVSSTLSSQYGDLVFSLTGLLSATPGVAQIGTPETLGGGGLTAGTTYVIAVGSGAGTVSTSAPALATFVATSTGQVPTGTSITLADTATTTETGTVMYLSVQTAAHFGVSTSSDAYAKFVLAASASVNMTSAPNGHSVTFTAHALNAGGAIYDLIFNYVPSPLSSTSYSGTTVGVLSPNTVGAGSITWNVPATALAGTYTVQLVVATQGTSGLAVGSAVLDQPVSFTVGTQTTSCNTTSCMTSSGTAALGTQGAYQGVSSSFTNNSNAPVTGFVYAVVHNALGQTIDISTATITAPAGGSASAFNVLFGLAPGTYSVSLFVTSSAGTAISSSSTVSVTIA